MTNKIAGLQYVDDFSFPAEQGFTGSAGKSSVKGYMRGGRVKATHETANANKHRAPSVSASHGGTVGVTTKQSKQMKQKASQGHYAKKSTKKAGGGYMEGGMHDKLYNEGSKMGYMRGGRVKDTSSEFVQKAGPQASMDEGVQPARRGRTQADVEAGGTKRLKMRLKKGGKVKAHGVHKVHPPSEKKMPKNVKARGGLMEYAEGGPVTRPSVGMLGKGAAANAARAVRTREERVRSTVDEALAGQRRSRQASPRPKARVQDKPAQARPRRIYREDKGGVPTFTDVPKVGKRVAGR